MRFWAIRLIYLKEMLDLLRDRRTIISMVIAPLLVIPLLFLGLNYYLNRTAKNAKEKQFRIALKQLVPVEGLSDALAQAGFNVHPSQDPRGETEKKDADLGLETTGGAQQRAVRIYADLTQFEVRTASDRIELALKELKDQRIKGELERLGVPESVLTPFSVENINVAAPQKMSGLMIGTMLGYMIVILMMTGGMYPAIDMTAGEKERRTMEMLLSSPAGREEIVLGKTLATITATVMTGLLTLASLGVSFSLSRAMMKNSAALSQSNDNPFDPWMLLLIVVNIFPMAILTSTATVAIAVMAKSFKEAQSYLTPMLLLAIIPAMISFLPGIKLSGLIPLIPIVNFSLLVKELFLREWTWMGYGLTLLANLVYAAAAMYATFVIFKKEHVLFRS